MLQIADINAASSLIVSSPQLHDDLRAILVILMAIYVLQIIRAFHEWKR